MSTGFTAGQIAELQETAMRLAPELPNAAALKSALEIQRVATAGTELGLLLRLSVKDKTKPITFFLNCVIALELMIGINKAATEAGWWDRPEESKAKPLPELQRGDLGGAHFIISLLTASEPNGLFVIFGDGDKTFTLYIPRRFAAELLAAISAVGERAKWWDENFQLLPLPN